MKIFEGFGFHRYTTCNKIRPKIVGKLKRARTWHHRFWWNIHISLGCCWWTFINWLKFATGSDAGSKLEKRLKITDVSNCSIIAYSIQIGLWLRIPWTTFFTRTLNGCQLVLIAVDFDERKSSKNLYDYTLFILYYRKAVNLCCLLPIQLLISPLNTETQIP